MKMLTAGRQKQKVSTSRTIVLMKYMLASISSCLDHAKSLKA